jgi:hypothetical protein
MQYIKNFPFIAVDKIKILCLWWDLIQYEASIAM